MQIKIQNKSKTWPIDWARQHRGQLTYEEDRTWGCKVEKLYLLQAQNRIPIYEAEAEDSLSLGGYYFTTEKEMAVVSAFRR